MGRNRKMGLDYFPFDIDTFQDIRIRKLIKYQGGKAMTVYALLLCLIYKGGYYMMWDEELPFIISEQTGFEEAYISEVIKSCLALGLFPKNYLKWNMCCHRKEYRNDTGTFANRSIGNAISSNIPLFLPRKNIFPPRK